MSSELIKQLELTRHALLGEVKKFDEKVLHVQPEGFNNSIHWHIGHVLTVTEQFVFGYPNQSLHIPANYIDLFGNGTKPADWNEDIPPVEKLTEQLTEQLERMKQLSPDHFEQKLLKPFLGQDTIGGLSAMSAYHEANHIGQMHAMNFTIKAANK